MSTLPFYREQAAACRSRAEASTLANVRTLNLEAAEAWEAMADRLTRTMVHRDANEAARAEADSSRDH
ncbi:hypothetical protein GCM10022281_22700 [Sphingomonas rosea]|jgi:hypothetical protein|uniref:Uncharacterized protein n=1 Tax=Sphingomonas rosea TaxID=335605 RepID=A0ABP7UDQ0_9SPHN